MNYSLSMRSHEQLSPSKIFLQITYISQQTLTKLDLSNNNLEHEDAERLAQALQQNIVTLQQLFHLYQISLLDLSLDTYTT